MGKLKIISLIGEPATGKSTITKNVMDALSEGIPFKERLLCGTYHPAEVLYIFGKYEIGNKFPGTDRLSMGVQPEAEFWLRVKANEPMRQTVFFEGDRLGNTKFLKTCESISDLYLFYISPHREEINRRHLKRGDSQTETFIKSRATKISNILKAFPNAIRIKNDNILDLAQCVNRIVGTIKG